MAKAQALQPVNWSAVFQKAAKEECERIESDAKHENAKVSAKTL